ncbi:hypothetical protein CVD28_05355 [Bacillus sp. M6-12]|uniref:Phenylacetic acid catabolic protein n=1 Tax=Bacillus sp. M6-12 TaxID=2054166 RepID=UPI000C76FF70|nr:Phenylacetic acid catabolic protein [Bacillus sp. M6-12]PLS18566.1 hypothetical protein CVD28_05355 [Bacillus sp. M6-12]
MTIKTGSDSAIMKILDDSTEQELNSLIRSIIGIKHALTSHYTHWCIKGPSLGASAGISAMVQEENGHIAILKRVITNQNELQQDNASLQGLKQKPENWSQVIANILVFDGIAYRVLSDLEDSNYEPLEKNILKIIKEEKFHQLYGCEWARLLISSDNFRESFIYDVQKAMEHLKEHSETLFPSEELFKAGIIKKKTKDILMELEGEIKSILYEFTVGI